MMKNDIAEIDPIWGQEIARLARELAAYKDAAEFEARVVEKLAGGEPFCPPFKDVSGPGQCAWDIWGVSYEKDYPEEKAIQVCKWCSLRAGRLAVEAEMEAEHDV